MLDYFAYHLTDITIYLGAIAVLFVVARSANAGNLLALAIATVPVGVAWVMLNPAARILLLGAP